MSAKDVCIVSDMDERPEIEPEPVVAARFFGERLDVARRFTADLVHHGETLGLIGPLESSRIWTRHILNSALLAPLLTTGARAGDVGSGAGLPGLVLAIARPDVDFVLIEPMERRVAWLTEEGARLGLDNVTVLRSRAEEAQLERPLDEVTARAVSALTKLLPVVVPLVRSGGRLLLMKGVNVDAEVTSAAKVIRRLRLADVAVDVLGEGLVPEPTRVFRATVD